MITITNKDWYATITQESTKIYQLKAVKEFKAEAKQAERIINENKDESTLATIFKLLEQAERDYQIKLRSTNVIALIKVGAHMHGTDTENSDTDYLKIYMPSKKDILMQDVIHDHHASTSPDSRKNTKTDVDTRTISIHKFFTLLKNFDPSTVEILFAPDDCIIESSPMWEQIMTQRHLFLCNNGDKPMEYCRNQINKYGFKDSNADLLRRFIDVLRTKEISPTFDLSKASCTTNLGQLINMCPKYEQVAYVYTGNSGEMYRICGKSFPLSQRVAAIIPVIEKMYSNYKETVEAAKRNEGIDWKRIAHAMRMASQMTELLLTGKISYPLRNAEFLKKVKLGELHYVNDGIEIVLEKCLDMLTDAVAESRMPKELNKDVIDELLIDIIDGNLN